MTNRNSHNHVDSECAFADALVAVLYNEASDAQRRAFELHAAQCEACRAEFAAFRAIGAQFAEYRAEVLQPLAAPAIVVAQTQEKQLDSSRGAWLNRLRAILFPTGNAWQTATAFAAFVVCAWLIFAAIISLRGGESQIAFGNSNKRQTIEKPADEPKTDSAQTPAPQIAPPQEELKPRAVPAKNSEPSVRAAKPAARAAQNKIVAPAAAKSRRMKSRPAVELEITADEEQPEDAAPRLADLFDEIGSLE